MRAIVLLFVKKTPTDSEEFTYPNIEEVRVSIEGIPNSLSIQGIPKSRLYEEASRVFAKEDQAMTLRKFFLGGFACVVDLRTLNDYNVTGTGKKLTDAQSGILLEIKKTATSANVMCKMFVLSDRLLNIANRDLANIQY